MQRIVGFFAIVFCFAVSGTTAYAAPQDGRYGRAQKNNEKGAGRLFEEADASHDGVLTREEARKILVLSNQFDDMDINQDGRVTRQEMVAFIKMKKKHHGRNLKNLP